MTLTSLSKVAALLLVVAIIPLAAATTVVHGQYNDVYPGDYSEDDLEYVNEAPSPPPNWNAWDWVTKNILDPLSGAFSWFCTQVGNVVEGIFTGAAGAVKQFFSGIGEAMYDLAKAPVKAVQDAWEKATDFTKSLPDWAKPVGPLVMTGVVMGAGLMIYYVVRSVIPGI